MSEELNVNNIGQPLFEKLDKRKEHADVITMKWLHLSHFGQQ